MSLFDDREGLVQHDAPSTSKAAAKGVLPKSGTRRREIYDWIAASRAGGTFDEIQDSMALTYNNVGPRVRELVEDGLVKDSGITRAGKSGQQQIVWVAVGAPILPVTTPEPEPVWVTPVPVMPQKRTRLELYEQVVSCTRCELHVRCSGPVGFTGPNPCSIAIVGEAPGATEDREGRPFVGPAGDLLRSHLRELEIDPDECFILNTVSCFPNGTLQSSHISACRQNKADQLALADPTWVLLLGRIALTATRFGPKIGSARGRPFRPGGESGPVYFSCYHPDAAIRNGELQKAMVEDLTTFAKMVGNGIEAWQGNLVHSCWECSSEEVVWVDPDYVMWCEKHAPPAYQERCITVDAELATPQAIALIEKHFPGAKVEA